MAEEKGARGPNQKGYPSFEVFQKGIKEIENDTSKIIVETQRQLDCNAQIDRKRRDADKLDQQINTAVKESLVSQTEQESLKKHANNLLDENRILELNRNKCSEEIPQITKAIEKTNELLDAKKKLLGDLNKEREIIRRRIDGSQQDHDGAEQELEGVVGNLGMLTDNYGHGNQEIQDALTRTSAEVGERVMDDVESYINDIVEFVKTLEQMLKSGEREEIDREIEAVDMYIANYDDSMNGLKESILEHIEAFTKDNSNLFNQFVHDLMDVINQVYITLVKLKPKPEPGQADGLHEFDMKRSSQIDEINILSIARAKQDGDLKHATIELKNLEAKIKANLDLIEGINNSIDARSGKNKSQEQKISELLRERSSIQKDIDRLAKERAESLAKQVKLCQEVDGLTKSLIQRQ